MTGDDVVRCQMMTKDDKSVAAPPPSRAGLDLATTLERIQQSFVVSDPNLPDCPIVFASDGFIEYTGCVPPAGYVSVCLRLSACPWR